jgi:hypothetical protein
MKEPRYLPEIPLVLNPAASSEASLAWSIVQSGDYRHKVGGEPDWIQGEETPECEDCQEPMVFFGQLDHLGDVEPLQDGGRIFVFYCSDCRQAAAVLQYY